MSNVLSSYVREPSLFPFASSSGCSLLMPMPQLHEEGLAGGHGHLHLLNQQTCSLHLSRNHAPALWSISHFRNGH